MTGKLIAGAAVASYIALSATIGVAEPVGPPRQFDAQAYRCDLMVARESQSRIAQRQKPPRRAAANQTSDGKRHGIIANLLGTIDDVFFPVDGQAALDDCATTRDWFVASNDNAAIAKNLPMMGVVARELSPEFARAVGMKHPQGWWIASVVPGSPADDLGLVPGDVVLSYADLPVATKADLHAAIADSVSRVDGATMSVWRNRERIDLALEGGTYN